MAVDAHVPSSPPATGKPSARRQELLTSRRTRVPPISVRSYRFITNKNVCALLEPTRKITPSRDSLFTERYSTTHARLRGRYAVVGRLAFDRSIMDFCLSTLFSKKVRNAVGIEIRSIVLLLILLLLSFRMSLSVGNKTRIAVRYTQLRINKTSKHFKSSARH